MKKSLIPIIFLLLLTSSVLAVETTLKEQYQPGETLIAEISGNFIDNIEQDDILFYSGRAYIGMIYDISKIKDKFYLYALLPNKERNYTLIIKDAHYIELGEEKTEDLEFSFTASGEQALFSVNPGFVITDRDFNIKVESRYQDITVISKFLNSTQETSISAGRTKTISFSTAQIKNFTQELLSIESGDVKYEIPVAVYKSEEEEEDVIISKKFRFSKSEYNFPVLKDLEFKFKIRLANTGQEDIEDITFDYPELEDITSIKPDEISMIEAGEDFEINITINSDETDLIQGEFQAVSGNLTTSTSIIIDTFEDEEEFEEQIEDTASTSTIAEDSCLEINGEKCEAGEECSGTYVPTSDGLCCVGNCKSGVGTTGKTIAVIAIIIVLGIIVFFVYKKVKSGKKGSKEVLEERQKSYEEKFKPKEVRGGLGRV